MEVIFVKTMPEKFLDLNAATADAGFRNRLRHLNGSKKNVELIICFFNYSLLECRCVGQPDY